MIKLQCKHNFAFQSKADHSRMRVFSEARLMFLLPWSQPWPDDLDIQTWHRYTQDVPACQKWSV